MKLFSSRKVTCFRGCCSRVVEGTAFERETKRIIIPGSTHGLRRALSFKVSYARVPSYTLWGYRKGPGERGLVAAQCPSIPPEVSGYHTGGVTWRKHLSNPPDFPIFLFYPNNHKPRLGNSQFEHALGT